MFVIKEISKKWGNGTTNFVENLKETESLDSFCHCVLSWEKVLSINFQEKLIKKLFDGNLIMDKFSYIY